MESFFPTLADLPREEEASRATSFHRVERNPLISTPTFLIGKSFNERRLLPSLLLLLLLLLTRVQNDFSREAFPYYSS